MKNDDLLPGVAVRTAATLEQRDFLPETIRRASVNGLVVRSKTGHGLCYEVRHVDGECGWYDPDELTLLCIAAERKSSGVAAVPGPNSKTGESWFFITGDGKPVEFDPVAHPAHADRDCCRMCESAWIAVNAKTAADRKHIFPCPKCKLWCCPMAADHRNTCLWEVPL